MVGAFATACSLLLFAALARLGPTDGQATKEGAAKPGAAESTAAWNRAAARLFAGSCLREAADEPRNVGLFVPAVVPLLHAVAEGTRGATREQLVALLGPLDHEANQERLRSLAGNEAVSFASGFKLWVDQALEPNRPWLDLVTGSERYAAELERVDFAHADAARLAADVNQWATRLVERDLRVLEPADLHLPLVRLILASAARVEWKWIRPFDARETRPQPFFRGPDRKVSVDVPMMRRHEILLRLAAVDGVPCAELLCDGGLKLVLVKVGGDRARRDELLSKADLVERIDAALAASRASLAEIELPKVKSQTKHDLRPVLESAGATLPFSPQADLSGLAGPPGLLYLDVLRHVCGVEWDEKGGRAYGASAAGVATRGGRLPGICFDEPFLALLRGADGTLLLLEWIEEPAGA